MEGREGLLLVQALLEECGRESRLQRQTPAADEHSRALPARACTTALTSSSRRSSAPGQVEFRPACAADVVAAACAWNRASDSCCIRGSPIWVPAGSSRAHGSSSSIGRGNCSGSSSSSSSSGGFVGRWRRKQRDGRGLCPLCLQLVPTARGPCRSLETGFLPRCAAWGAELLLSLSSDWGEHVGVAARRSLRRAFLSLRHTWPASNRNRLQPAGWTTRRDGHVDGTGELSDFLSYE